MSRVIRVIVADDSKFVRDLLVSYIESAGDMEVIATAEDGRHALDLVHQLRPDVVTLDIDMPHLSGLEALTEIMLLAPTPAVMVSGVSLSAAATTLQALQRGAVDFILKYVPEAAIDPAEMRLDVISKVRTAANVKVVRAISSRLPHAEEGAALSSKMAIPSSVSAERNYRVVDPNRSLRHHAVAGPGIVVIGASTGGPIAIRQLLGQLSREFPVPILIVQHVPEAFNSVLLSQLANDSPFTTQLAATGIVPKPGNVYIAPGDRHLLMTPHQSLECCDGPKISGHRPSIDITMKSLAQNSRGPVYGVLLTGMGEDGASGLQYIRARGGRTFAQSAETCVVNGMPQRALELGAVDIVGSPTGIAEHLNRELLQDTEFCTPLVTPKDSNHVRIIASFPFTP